MPFQQMKTCASLASHLLGDVMCMSSSETVTALGGDAKEGSQDLRPGCDAPRAKVQRSATETAVESKRGSLPLRCCDCPRDSCSRVAAATCTEDCSFCSVDGSCTIDNIMHGSCLKHVSKDFLRHSCSCIPHHSCVLLCKRNGAAYK